MKFVLPIFVISASALFAEPTVTPGQLAAAKELTVTIGADKQVDLGLQTMMPMINNMAARMRLSEADSEELKGIYKSWFTGDVDQPKLLQSLINNYAEIFTEKELIELNNFYKSPLGQKTLASMPEVIKKSSMAAMEETKAKEELLKKRLQPFLEKHPVASSAPGTPAPSAPVPTPAPVPAPAPVAKP